MIETLTIVEAWNKLKAVENEISLLETLRATKDKKNIKATSLKDMIVSGGGFSNDALINALTIIDEYTERLQALYTQKNAYEKFILDEINRLKISNQGIVIGFLKEHQRMKWNEIADYMIYSEKQCRRFYSEYKGKTPKDNCWSKDDQK